MVERTARDRTGEVGFAAIFVAIQVSLWVGFFDLHPSDRHAVHVAPGLGLFGPATVPLALGLPSASIVAAVLAGLFVGLSPRYGFGQRLTALLLLLSATVNFFATRYWSLGTPANFTQSLTQLDATYFALGSLTGGGTGPINATSQTARTWLTVQLAWSFIVLTAVVGITLTHLSDRLGRMGQAAEMTEVSRDMPRVSSEKALGGVSDEPRRDSVRRGRPGRGRLARWVAIGLVGVAVGAASRSKWRGRAVSHGGYRVS